MLFKRKIYDKLIEWKISLGEELVNVNITLTKKLSIREDGIIWIPVYMTFCL